MSDPTDDPVYQASKTLAQAKFAVSEADRALIEANHVYRRAQNDYRSAVAARKERRAREFIEEIRRRK